MTPNTHQNKNNKDCDYPLTEKEIPFGDDGGYSIIKYCKLCHYMEGYTFFDKKHELNYIKQLLDEGEI